VSYSEKARREASIRRLANKLDLAVRKSRYRHPELKDWRGGYMLVDAATNTIVLGAVPNAFSATLDDVESYLDDLFVEEAPVAYEIVDPLPIARRTPSTFWVPSDEMLAAIGPGDFVKVIVRAIPPRPLFGAERLWVKVVAADGIMLSGTLANDPLDLPGLHFESEMRFRRSDVIAIEGSA
jgi:hypothetical protein